MSEKAISQANLNEIERNLDRLTDQLDSAEINLSVVHSIVDSVQGKVNSVQSTVDSFNSKVDSVQQQISDIDSKVQNVYNEFLEFVNEARSSALINEANQEIIKLKQVIEEDYSFYDKARRHVTGILQASDVSIVKKETIEKATQDIMMDTPKYWLAPALVALSAWISDNRPLAELALKEAMKRDDEKTSLLFCLICRRADRLSGSMTWLERYFGMQDPNHMGADVIVVLEAFSSGIFGPDSKGLCSDKITEWIDELSQKADFTATQRVKWKQAIKGKTGSFDENSFPLLIKHCTSWETLKDVMKWAHTHEEIDQYLKGIFESQFDNTFKLEDKLDEILDKLVNNYNYDELHIREKLRYNELIIEERADMVRVKDRFESEKASYEQYHAFSQHLTTIAMSPNVSGAEKSTQKLAISLSKEWIVDAYNDLTAESRSNVSSSVEIEVSGWKGNLSDGSEETELCESIERHADNELNFWLTENNVKFRHWIALLAGMGIAVFNLIGGNGAMVILGLLITCYYVHGKIQSKKKQEELRVKYKSIKEDSVKIVKGICAEMVDFRKLYSEKDSEYDEVIHFINQLDPTQYIGVGDKKTRQIIS